MPVVPSTPHRKIADLTERHPFDSRPFCLWRCANCKGYFAARRPASLLDGPFLVGLFVPPSEPDYKENRRLNRGRRKWAAAQEGGNLCVCESTADWERLDDLHVLLPENPEEWKAAGYLGFPWD